MSTNTKLWIATILSLVGGWLLIMATNQGTPVGQVALFGWLGLIGLVVIAGWLMASYRPGRDLPNQGEHPNYEWKWARFLRLSYLSAPLYLGIRLFLAYEWWDGFSHKFADPKWISSSEGIRAYWERAVAVPATGSPPIAYPAYRSFIQFMLDNHWDGWFTYVIVFGEFAVAIGMLLGLLTGVAALGGMLMNFTFLFAGSTSSNPLLLIFEAMIIYGWLVAGWYGLDRWALTYLAELFGHKEAPMSAPAPQTSPGVAMRR